jgi:hypothetical protein
MKMQIGLLVVVIVDKIGNLYNSVKINDKINILKDR